MLHSGGVQVRVAATARASAGDPVVRRTCRSEQAGAPRPPDRRSLPMSGYPTPYPRGYEAHRDRGDGGQRRDRGDGGQRRHAGTRRRDGPRCGGMRVRGAAMARAAGATRSRGERADLEQAGAARPPDRRSLPMSGYRTAVPTWARRTSLRWRALRRHAGASRRDGPRCGGMRVRVAATARASAGDPVPVANMKISNRRAPHVRQIDARYRCPVIGRPYPRGYEAHRGDGGQRRHARAGRRDGARFGGDPVAWVHADHAGAPSSVSDTGIPGRSCSAGRFVTRAHQRLALCQSARDEDPCCPSRSGVAGLSPERVAARSA